MTSGNTIHIRSASAADKDFIVSLVPRLTEFGPPAWRESEQMTEFDTQVLVHNLMTQPAGTAIFIAEDDHKIPLGFIHLFPGDDYYNKQQHGHISDLIVTAAGQGKGVGTKLIAAAEAWAREQGYRWLTLSVFAQNSRAKDMYERLGFGQDMIRYVKMLD